MFASMTSLSAHIHNENHIAVLISPYLQERRTSPPKKDHEKKAKPTVSTSWYGMLVKT